MFTRKTMRFNRLQSRRLCAEAIVLVLIVSPWCVQLVVDTLVPQAEAAEFNRSEIVLPVDKAAVDAIDACSDPLRFLEQLEEQSRQGLSDDSSFLQDEITIPSDAANFRCDTSALIFSFEIKGTAASVMQELAASWADKAWHEVPLGGVNGSTFIKEEGIYTWMLVNCTQIGTDVCVVGYLN